MDETSQLEAPRRLGTKGGLLVGVALFAVLLPLSRVNYLLFHSLVEITAVVVAFGIFVIAWNTRRTSSSRYLSVLGTPQLFVGAVLLLHMLSYKGMGVFVGYGTNLPTQLWIVARLLVVAAFLVAGVSLRRRVSPVGVFLTFGAVTVVALAMIFVWGVFPTMYAEGAGLTPLKVAAEYAIVALAALALWLLWRDRDRFEPQVARLLAGSMLMMILAELSFTLYVDVYGALSFLGHYLSLCGFMMIYLAIIETALVRPFDLIFLELQRRVRAEHDIADALQSAMLMAPSRVGCLEMGTAYVSAEGFARVGGDFYDLFKPLNRSVAFVVGDVCGKGIEAATSTTMVQTTLRSFAYGSAGPREVLGSANASLSHQFRSDKFATVIYGVANCDTGMLRLGSAGHPDPILCRDEKVACIELPRNPPLSVLAPHEFEVAEVRLVDGDIIIMFTDGLLDAGRRMGEYGIDRILLSVPCESDTTPKEIADTMMSAVQAYAGDELDDDVAIVVLRYTADVAE